MGCFDSLFVKCPNCKSKIEYQTKGGGCDMQKYRLHNAPPIILGSLDGEIEECKCGTKVIIKTIASAQVYEFEEEPEDNFNFDEEC